MVPSISRSLWTTSFLCSFSWLLPKYPQHPLALQHASDNAAWITAGSSALPAVRVSQEERLLSPRSVRRVPGWWAVAGGATQCLSQVTVSQGFYLQHLEIRWLQSFWIMRIGLVNAHVAEARLRRWPGSNFPPYWFSHVKLLPYLRGRRVWLVCEGFFSVP